MKTSSALQQTLFEQLCKQHVFHPLARMKPTVGSQLLSEQKESLLHSLSLLDDIGVNLSSQSEWESIYKEQYARLRPNSFEKVSFAFCMLEPLDAVNTLTNEQLIEKFDVLEYERIKYLQEYQDKLDDIMADPIDLVDPKEIIYKKYADTAEYTTYISKIKRILNQSGRCSSQYAYLSPVPLKQPVLTDYLLEIAPVGTVFENLGKTYVLQPYFTTTRQVLQVNVFYPCSFEFVRFEGNFALMINKTTDSQVIVSITNQTMQNHANQVKFRGYHDHMCSLDHGSLVFWNKRFSIQHSNVDEFCVYTEDSDFYLAYLAYNSVFVSKNFQAAYNIAFDADMIYQDGSRLLISNYSGSSMYDFVTGKQEMFNFAANQMSNSAFLLQHIPVFFFNGQKIQTYSGHCRRIRHVGKLILLEYTTKVVVFRENERSPLLQLCPRPNSKFTSAHLFENLIVAVSESELMMWRINDILYTIQLSDYFNDELLEYVGAAAGQFFVFDSMINGKIIAFYNGVGLVEIQ